MYALQYTYTNSYHTSSTKYIKCGGEKRRKRKIIFSYYLCIHFIFNFITFKFINFPYHCVIKSGLIEQMGVDRLAQSVELMPLSRLSMTIATIFVCLFRFLFDEMKTVNEAYGTKFDVHGVSIFTFRFFSSVAMVSPGFRQHFLGRLKIKIFSLEKQTISHPLDI